MDLKLQTFQVVALRFKSVGTSKFKCEAFSEPYATPRVTISHFLFNNLSRTAAPHISGHSAETGVCAILDIQAALTPALTRHRY